ncbi:hypothetical protein V8C37DRAFT_194028 [Trichoderma ceciliae]
MSAGYFVMKGEKKGFIVFNGYLCLVWLCCVGLWKNGAHSRMASLFFPSSFPYFFFLILLAYTCCFVATR